MSYITNTLGKDEKVELVIKQHWMNYFLFGFCAFALLTSLFQLSEMPDTKPLFFLLILTIYLFFRSYMKEMILTNQRVIKKSGVIGTTTSEIRKKQIESVSIDQSVLDRLFGKGDIVFSGTGRTHFKLKNVKNPIDVKKKIEDILL